MRLRVQCPVQELCQSRQDVWPYASSRTQLASGKRLGETGAMLKIIYLCYHSTEYEILHLAPLGVKPLGAHIRGAII